MSGAVVQAMFAFSFVVALGSSLAMLFSRNAVHVALFLVAAQVALAVTFLLQGAFFIAMIQIIVYAGAIMVLFLFVIMLLGVDRFEILKETLRGQRPLAIVLGLIAAACALYIAARGSALVPGPNAEGAIEAINRAPGNVQGVARVLFGTYTLPFEATSVLLVVAIVGVMVMARRISAAGGLRRAEAEEAPEKEEAA